MKVPALLVWSTDGKSGTGFFTVELLPGRAGVAASKLSGMGEFEGLDSNECVGRGYDIVNVDARVFKSESDIV